MELVVHFLIIIVPRLFFEPANKTSTTHCWERPSVVLTMRKCGENDETRTVPIISSAFPHEDHYY